MEERDIGEKKEKSKDEIWKHELSYLQSVYGQASDEVIELQSLYKSDRDEISGYPASTYLDENVSQSQRTANDGYDMELERSSPTTSTSNSLNSSSNYVGNLKSGANNTSYTQFSSNPNGNSINSEEIKKQFLMGRGFPNSWNERFQKTQEMPQSTEQKRLEKFTQLINLAKDFTKTAQRYGKIIIAECFLPFECKTIRPVSEVGGQAGGEKYIFHDIIFKFSSNWKNLYENDAAAQKAAGHELKGLMSMYKCNVKGLSFPLCCLIEYRGFRLVAMSVLPISNETLVYGSSDAGRTVRDEDPQFKSIVSLVCQKLNLKKHVSGIFQQKELMGPCDMEGHKGTDGRFYVIDFQRLMPPEPIDKKIKGCFLFRLLRPELVKHFAKPLSSDAYSSFGHINKEEHNKEAGDATKMLREEVIPKVAKILDNEEELNYEALIQIIHREGVNCRYLGELRKKVESLEWQKVIMHEMIARSIRYKLREMQREEMKRLKTLADESYKTVVIDMLNTVLGRMGTASDQFWTVEVKEQLKKQFYSPLNETESRMDYSLKTDIEMNSLMTRVQQLSGIKLTAQANEELKEDPDSFEIVYPDIEKISAKVRFMQIVDHSEASALAIQSRAKKGRERQRIQRLASSKFQTALSWVPDNEETLSGFGDFLVQKGMQTPNFDEKLESWKEAYQHYKTAKNFLAIQTLAEAIVELDQLRIPDKTIQNAVYEVANNCLQYCAEMNEDSKPTFYYSWGDILSSMVQNELQWRDENTMSLIALSASKYRIALKRNPSSKCKLPGFSEWASQLADADLVNMMDIVDRDPTFSSVRTFSKKFLTDDYVLLTQHFSPPTELHLMHGEWISMATIVLSVRRGIKSLRYINLLRCYGVSSVELREISQCSNLKKIILDHTAIGDEGIGYLAKGCSKLKKISLENCNFVSDSGVNSLRALKHLQSVNLSSNNQISDKSIVETVSNWPELKNLQMKNCSLITDTSILEVANYCTALEKIGVLGAVKLQNKSIGKLVENCQKLTRMDISMCFNITDEAFEKCNCSTSLKRIWLSNCDKITDVGLDLILKNSTGIQALDVRYTQVTDRSLQSISLNSGSLEEFRIKRSGKISDKMISNLCQKAPFLKTLELHGKIVHPFLKLTKLQRLFLAGNKLLSEAAIMQMVDHSTNLTELDISDCLSITDSVIAYVGKKCKNLQILRVDSCTKLTAIPITSPNLRVLSLQLCSKVGDKALSEVIENCPNLQYLNILRCIIRTPTFSCAKLQELVGSRHLSDSAMIKLVSIATNLNSLTLDSSSFLSVKSLEAIAQKATNLGNLSLAYCSFVTDENCHFFSGLPKLTRLTVSGTDLVEAPIKSKSVRTICLNDCPKVREEAVERMIVSCENLRKIECISCPIISSSLAKDLRKTNPNLQIVL